MSIGAALTIVSSPYIQSNASEFDCCQEQIIDKCLSVLKMKQTKMAEGLLTKSKGRQHQNQTAIAQPTFFFLITLGRGQVGKEFVEASGEVIIQIYNKAKSILTWEFEE